MTKRRMLGISAAIVGLVAAGFAGAQQAGFVRTPLSDSEMSVAGRHGVMARVEIDAGVSSGRHTHPGEEFGYVLEGTFEVTVDGKAPVRLAPGSVFFIPANAIHEGKNVGTTKARVMSTYVVETGKPLATPVPGK
jgi:quercetin dioxygenase-like cupin family protein